LIDKEGDHIAVILYLLYCKVKGEKSEWLEISCSTFMDFDQEHIKQTGDDSLLMDYRAAKQERNREFELMWPIIVANPRVFG